MLLPCDAWVAKGQPIQKNSIVLVHGNGNEHDGIIELMPLLNKLTLSGLTEAL